MPAGRPRMAVYYTIAGIYGYAVWKYGKKHNQKEKEELPISYMKKSLYLPTLLPFPYGSNMFLHPCRHGLIR